VDWLGELARDLIAPIYPLRVPIAIGTVVAVGALGLVGWRLGWFAAARRHPARTLTAALLVLAIVVPLGWYLGSPLFITTSLDEPAPPASASSSPPGAAATPGPTSRPSTAPMRTIAGRSGAFVGVDEFHFGRGSATLLESPSGGWIVRFDEFAVRNGPDLYVYLSPDPAGYVDGAIELGNLKANEGSFNTEVPAGIDVTPIRSVVIWCKAFSVEFAVAELR
jgi:hypothetical protein